MKMHYKIRRIRKIHEWSRKAELFNRVLQCTILLPITLFGVVLQIIKELMGIFEELLEYLTGDAWLKSYRFISRIIRWIFTLGRDPEFRINRINDRLEWHDEYILKPMRRRKLLEKHRDTPDTEIPEDWK